MKLKFNSVFLFITLVMFTSCLNENHNPDHPHNTSFYIDYRSLKGASDGIAVIRHRILETSAAGLNWVLVYYRIIFIIILMQKKCLQQL